MLLAQTKYLCKKYGLKPHRPAGQNFLISENIVEKIIGSAEVKKSDIVLEVGPGFGFITKGLAEKAKQVYAIELDKRLAECMRAIAKNYKNLKVIQKDIMKVNLSELVKDGEYKLVSNLPYNITSWVLRNFLEYQPRPSLVVLLVQKEIGQRIVAQPGEMSLLSLAVQALSKPEVVDYIPSKSFWPQPKVDSALVRLAPEFMPGLQQEDLKPFFRLAKAGFSAKRKKILNSLSGGMALDKAKISQILTESNIDPSLRAEDLKIKDWLELYKNIF